MKYCIIYHREDNDGVFSAAIAMYYLKHVLKIQDFDITTMGMSYADMNEIAEKDVPLTSPEDNIIILDISFPGNYMKKLYSYYGKNLTWIDHHAPIIKESFNKHFDEVYGLRDTHHSTIYNIYKYFFNPLDEAEMEIPEFLNNLQLWDSWTYKPEDRDFIQAFNIGVTLEYNLDLFAVEDIVTLILDAKLSTKNQSQRDIATDMLKCGGFGLTEYFEKIDKIKTEYNKCLNTGKTIQRTDAIRNKNLIQSCGDFNWMVNGRPACALFMQGPSNSLMFKSVLEHIKNGIIFKHNLNGTWTVSLYNVNEDTFDCGAYLKAKYKGGGHIGAAGAVISNNKFQQLLRTKEL